MTWRLKAFQLQCIFDRKPFFQEALRINISRYHQQWQKWQQWQRWTWHIMNFNAVGATQNTELSDLSHLQKS